MGQGPGTGTYITIYGCNVHVINGKSNSIKHVEIKIYLCLTNNLETHKTMVHKRKFTEHGFGKYIV